MYTRRCLLLGVFTALVLTYFDHDVSHGVAKGHVRHFPSWFRAEIGMKLMYRYCDPWLCEGLTDFQHERDIVAKLYGLRDNGIHLV